MKKWRNSNEENNGENSWRDKPMDSRKKSESVFSLAILLISISFYLIFACVDRVCIFPDSQGYISMDMHREPFYPLFLALLRWVFGGLGDTWLFWAVIAQSLLAALATWSLVCCLNKELKLNYVISFMVLGILLGVSLLCRFGAGRAAMYSNSIMSEGISLPLFLLFIRYLLVYILHGRKKELFLSSAFSFILISTRKQMYLTLFLLVIAIFYIMWKEKKYGKGLLMSILCGVVILLSCQLFDMGYNFAIRGVFMRHSKDNRFMATMVFYVANREDAEEIENQEVREIFEQIYDICDQNGYLKNNAGKNWSSRVNHFGNNYDYIQIDVMGKFMQEYVRGMQGDSAMYDYVAAAKQVDAITSDIIESVMPRVWIRMIPVFADNFLKGLLTTVIKEGPISLTYMIMIYVAYVLGLIWNIKKYGFNGVSVLATITLFSVLINVALVSAVIFCQSRYTIYNMPLFYISGLLLWMNVMKKHSSTNILQA